MLPVIWRAMARANLTTIIRFVANENPLAARRLRVLIEAAVLPIAEHPYLYRSGKIPGTRKIIAHPNYMVVYRVLADRIEIINVVHTRCEYPIAGDE
jgi:toxin ParE1/3/4